MLRKIFALFLVCMASACGGGGSSSEPTSGVGSSSNFSDRDGDGVADDGDEFPDDSTESADSDGDGVGDNTDAFPNNSTETADTDGDGVGDNTDAFPNNSAETADADGDGIGDNTDAFPNNSAETADTDGDGVGNNTDAFPNNSAETADSDGDGVGDNSDALPQNPAETVDSDGDGVGDNTDVFPNNSAETADTDGDGVGDNTDAFPNNSAETADSDGDGVGDNTDAFPNNSAETADSDGDGVGDNSDVFPQNPAETVDSDGDGIGDNSDNIPSPFAFNSIEGAPVASLIASQAIQIFGITQPAPISIERGEYQIGTEEYTNNPGLILPGQSVSVRLTSSESPSTVSVASLTIGGETAGFLVTTIADMAPVIQLEFPPANSITEFNSLTFRGKTTDDFGLTNLSINGNPVSSSDNFATWSANVELEPGMNILTLTARDSGGNSSNIQASIRQLDLLQGAPWALAKAPEDNKVFALFNRNIIRAVDLNTGLLNDLSGGGIPDELDPVVQASGLALDRVNNRVLVSQVNNGTPLIPLPGNFRGQLLGIDIDTGQRSVISDNSIPDNINPLLRATDVVIDHSRNRALIIEEASIIAVNLSTGARSILSNFETPDSTNRFQSLTAIELDTAHNRALVIDQRTEALIAVDLNTGARTVLSDTNTPNSTNRFSLPSDISLGCSGSNALVTDARNNRILSVDLESGERTVLSSNGPPNSRVPLDAPFAIVINCARNQAVVADPFAATIIEVDLDTGERRRVSDAHVPDLANRFRELQSLALDKDNNRTLVLDINISTGVIYSVDAATSERSLVSSSFIHSSGNELRPKEIALLRSTDNAVVNASGGSIGGLFLFNFTTNIATPIIETSNSTLMGLELDMDSNRAFVADSETLSLLAVDLNTGLSTVISGNSFPGLAVDWTVPESIKYDPLMNRLIVLDKGRRMLVAVDLETGERSLISDNLNPNESNQFLSPDSVVLDLTNNRALVANTRAAEILEVDLISGERRVLINLLENHQESQQLIPPFQPSDMEFDERTNQLFLIDIQSNSLITIDLNTNQWVVHSR